MSIWFNFQSISFHRPDVNHGQQKFSGKGQIIHILGCTGHTVSVTMTQLGLYPAKATINNRTWMVMAMSNKTLFIRQGAGFGPLAHSRRPQLWTHNKGPRFYFPLCEGSGREERAESGVSWLQTGSAWLCLVLGHPGPTREFSQHLPHP